MATKKKSPSRATKASQPTLFQIEWVDIDSIKLWEDNPRFNDEASEKLAGIIKDHGIKSPIVCWDKNRTIYKGNTTYKACKLLGMDKVPVVFHSFDSEVSAKAYGIADNKASEMAEWDEELLLNMMQTKEFKEADLTTGFTDREIELMDFWPPSEEQKETAKTQNKKLKFKIAFEVGADEYQEVKKALENLADNFETVAVR